MTTALFAGTRSQRAVPGSEVEGATAALGREAVVNSVLEELRNEESNGVILVGDYGVGKTFIAREIIEHIGPDVLVLSLRCTSVTARMEFGALNPIMADLGEMPPDNPLVVLRSVTQLLKDRAKGRSIVLFVDNIHQADERSAMVITQLAATGVVFLLAASESLPAAPSEIVGLWRDGLIKRVDVDAFTEVETGQWLEALLGAKVSKSAVRALWAGGGGNPRFLEVIIHEQVTAGTLVKREGIWIVTGAPFACGPGSIDTVMAAFRSVSAGERTVAELLALSGGLPLNQLMALCDGEHVDSLQQRGYLVVDHHESATVRLANRLMEQVLRAQVPTGHSRELLGMVQRSMDSASGPGGMSFDLAAWAIDCGIPLDDEAAIAAAHDATTAGFPGEALRIANTVSRRPRQAGRVTETVRALVALGEYAKARSVAFDPDLELGHLPLAEWTELMLLRCGLSRGQEHAGFDPFDILEQVRQRLDAEEAVAGPSGGDVPGNAGDGTVPSLLGEELAMATVKQLMHAGRYYEAALELERLYRNGSSGMRTRAAHWLVGAWILTGRVTDAFNVAEEIGLRELPPDMSGDIPRISDSALMFAVVVSLTAEGPTPGLSRAPACTFVGARFTAYEELAEGLVDACCGRADKALEHLVPVASQLAQLGESGTHALACAAIAYAYALKGDIDIAWLHLNEVPAAPASSRLVGVGCRYFVELATAELSSADKAIVRLLAMADQERQFRTATVEMMLCHAAVRLGSAVSAQRLVAVASRVKGPLSRICEAFGKGLMARNVTTLLEAAGAAANQGDDLLARDVARAALRIANENADREGGRLAQQLIREGVLRLGRVRVTSEDGQVLTVREQEIAAEAASGESNKAIAAKMHISVRTVEGHLYQVYSKLRVTSRNELRAALE
ncbi:LuxR family transcriptional regulator [Arthrobacter sp. SDTb3-6]|uniref:LuxR family transcriptional regulator n=1 Tax=Arthrobacter sp. SDTb3-6 TaxID=2713571 RepID=UPI00159DCCBD|nr:LuxR family transcriptional regulator [Arthrobacter sp. SDTb3-6]NVM99266.1 AAA family ATPase [Arthrobacter sp. SDTb3-6]